MVKKLSSILLVALLASSAFAQDYQWKEAKSGGYSYKYVTNDPSNARFYTLKNGLTVILSPTPKDPRIQAFVAVKAGSKTDPATNTGLAHYLEHMLFKGTAKRTSRQIINRLEDVGGELNAYTSKEETVVYAGFLNEYTERSIELIADIVQNSVFPQNEIDKEIEIIQDEIQSYNDSPSELIFDDFEELLFKPNPMAHNVLGNKKNIEQEKMKNIRVL